MASISTVSDGTIDSLANRFRSVDITEEGGTWSVVATVDGFDDPVVVAEEASEEDAVAAVEQLTDDLDEPDAEVVFDDVTVLGTLRSALSGERIEVGTDEISRADFYDANGDLIGSVQARSIGGTSSLVVDGPGGSELRLSNTSEGGAAEMSAEGWRVLLDQLGVNVEGPMRFLDTTDGFIDLPLLGSAPSAPAAGSVRLYARVESTVAHVFVKRSNGVEVQLT